MKCQSLFSGKNKEKYIKILSAGIFPSMLSVKGLTYQILFKDV